MKKKPESGKGRNDDKTTTKVDVAILRRARMVSLQRNVDLFDYIDSILRPAIDRDYAAMIRDEAKGRE